MSVHVSPSPPSATGHRSDHLREAVSRAVGVGARVVSTLAVAAFLTACAGDGPMEVIDPANPCEKVTPIRLGQSLEGRLSATDCQEPDGRLADRWELTVTSVTTVQLQIVSPAFDAFLQLQDPTGRPIAEYHDGGGPPVTGIVETLAPGSYPIVARNLDPTATGSYQLSATEAPSCAPVGIVAVGDVVTGSVNEADCLFEWGGHQDHWTLTLDRPLNLRLEAKSPDFDELLLIRDEDSNIWEGADWQHPVGFARIDTGLPPGVWTISVVSPDPDQTGSYELAVGLAPPCTPGTALVSGETEHGVIDDTDCVWNGWTQADSFAIELDEPTAVDLLMKSPDFRPVMVLFDGAGEWIVDAWDETGDGSARTSMFLDAGDYALLVLPSDYAERGTYALTYTESACDDPLALVVGETVEGTLGEGDCIRENGAHMDRWAIELADSTDLRIDLESDAFDALLTLEDTAGIRIASDDDSGVERNALLQISLPPGHYVIGATSFARGQAGDYRLSVRGPDAAMAVAPSDPVAAPQPKDIAPEAPSYAPVLKRLRQRIAEGSPATGLGR